MKMGITKLLNRSKKTRKQKRNSSEMTKINQLFRLFFQNEEYLVLVNPCRICIGD